MTYFSCPGDFAINLRGVMHFSTSIKPSIEIVFGLLFKHELKPCDNDFKSGRPPYGEFLFES